MHKGSLALAAAALLSGLPVYAGLGDDLSESTIDLQGVALQPGKIARAATESDAISASPLYQYQVSGTVTGSGAFSFIEAGTDVADALDQIQAGFSENLSGVIINPSSKLPFIVVNKKLKGSFDVGPVKVTAKANVQAGITKPGQTFFSFTQVSVSTNSPIPFPIPANSKITFDAGSTCHVFVPPGSANASKPDLIVSAEPDPVGNNIYNTTGASQTLGQALKKNQAYSFNLLIQNDGTAADSITITGPKGDDNVTVSYKVGKKNVTKQVSGDGYVVSDIPSLGGKVIKVTVKAKVKDATFSGLILATGASDSDTVGIQVGPL
jgi:hypothetical protein